MAQAEYILALDYGDKRVGVAIAHQIARLPRPLITLANGPELLTELQSLIDQEAVAQVIVGLPRGMDGGYTAQTQAAEAFANRLSAEVTVPVILADETLTSVDAETNLHGQAYDKAQIDALAASYILERYLQEQASREGSAHEI